MLLTNAFLVMRNMCGKVKELDQFDSYKQSEADRRRSLGNSDSLPNREPHSPGLYHPLTVSLRPGPRREAVRMEGHCCLHGHHSDRQQHPGK